jgi:serine/threonine protein kinase, bacterial
VTDPEDAQAASDEAAPAWSQDDTDDSVPYVQHSPVWRRLVLAGAWGAIAFLLLGGSVLTLIGALKHPPRPTVNPPAKSARGPIDGTYRVDRYPGEATTRTPDGKVSASAPGYSSAETEWWAFQSACPTPSCIAAGTRLDDTTHTQIAAGLVPGQAEHKELQSLRLVNGQWVIDPPYLVPQDCAAGIPGQDILQRLTLELTQLGDGTLKGQESALAESNECGSAGTVVTTPVVATRIGDVPSGLPPLKTK